MEEDIEVTDLQQERYKYRNSELAWRIADISPDEPIVRYTWPSRKIQVVFDRASEAVQRNYRGISIPQNRETLYDIGGVEITTEDVDAVVDETIAFGYDELAEMLQAEAYEGEGSE